MKRIHLLLSLTSLNVLFVTLERFSPTTRIILQPYNFLRLHEMIQMTLLILFTVIIPFFMLKETSQNFTLLKTKKGTIFGLLFLIGVYFYATGNGLHEVASFFFNTFCDTKHVTTLDCGSMYFNDYYTGNILYFFGAFFMVLVPILFERIKPTYKITKRDTLYLAINALIYALAIFAYAAFDLVLVGLWYSMITTAVVLILIFAVKKKISMLPLTLYTGIAYTIGTLAAILFRFG